MDIQKLTIRQACDMLSSGSLTKEQLSQACYKQIYQFNKKFNAYITVIENAHLLNESKGALSGIPIGVKDLYQTKGIPTTAGTPFFRDYIPEKNALTVSKLIQQGAVINGKTNTHEIALGVTGINPHYGTVPNPWNPERISGGSSSGSVVAVATGMALGALGTDTGGSNRIPASLCGVVGLKPTFGRVSTRGIFPLSWNLDHPGPLTKTVTDAAILLQVLAGYDESDPYSAAHPVDDYLDGIDAGVEGLKIGILDGDYSWDAEPDVLEIIREAGEVLATLGAAVLPVELNFLRDAALANSLMVLSDGAAFHKSRMQEDLSRFGSDIQQRLSAGAEQSSVEYTLARKTQTEARRQMELFFHSFDALLLPSTPIPAPLIAGTNAIEQARRLTRFTAPFNLTGLPAISVPAGFTSEGMPVGLQLVTSHWSEKKLLRIARAFEKATPWHTHLPKLGE